VGDNTLNTISSSSSLDKLLDNTPGSGLGAGDNNDGSNFDFSKKRVSKAEVLDIAGRYIRLLGRKRDALETERDELVWSMA
jgi:hypothetical protein